MKKTELAKKIERKPWSLFIRNIPPFLHATNQPLVIIHHHNFLKKLYVVLGAYYRLTRVVRSERPREALLMTYKNPGTKIKNRIPFTRRKGNNPIITCIGARNGIKINTTSVNNVSVTARAGTKPQY